MPMPSHDDVVQFVLGTAIPGTESHRPTGHLAPLPARRVLEQRFDRARGTGLRGPAGSGLCCERQLLRGNSNMKDFGAF